MRWSVFVVWLLVLLGGSMIESVPASEGEGGGWERKLCEAFSVKMRLHCQTHNTNKCLSLYGTSKVSKQTVCP